MVEGKLVGIVELVNIGKSPGFGPQAGSCILIHATASGGPFPTLPAPKDRRVAVVGQNVLLRNKVLSEANVTPKIWLN